MSSLLLDHASIYGVYYPDGDDALSLLEYTRRSIHVSEVDSALLKLMSCRSNVRVWELMSFAANHPELYQWRRYDPDELMGSLTRCDISKYPPEVISLLVREDLEIGSITLLESLNTYLLRMRVRWYELRLSLHDSMLRTNIPPIHRRRLGYEIHKIRQSMAPDLRLSVNCLLSSLPVSESATIYSRHYRTSSIKCNI